MFTVQEQKDCNKKVEIKLNVSLSEELLLNTLETRAGVVEKFYGNDPDAKELIEIFKYMQENGTSIMEAKFLLEDLEQFLREKKQD